MNNLKSVDVVTRFHSLATGEMKDDDVFMLVSGVINGFVKRSAFFRAIDEKKRRYGLRELSPIIEA